MTTHKRDRLNFWEKILFFLEKYLASAFILALGSTFRYKILTAVPEKPVIIAFWHRNILPLIYTRKFENAAIIISSSKDGELIAGPCRALGYKPIRGSSRRHGIAAAKEFIRAKDSRLLGITPDGPKGPSEKIKVGLPTLSYLSKIPISMMSADVDKEIVFKTWDKFRLPLPFTRINISYSEPILIEKKEDIADSVLKLEKIMQEQDIKNKIR